MSSNRLIYDTCAYKKTLDESFGPLSYLLNPIKYENCNKCRMELGIVGGSNVRNSFCSFSAVRWKNELDMIRNHTRVLKQMLV